MNSLLKSLESQFSSRFWLDNPKEIRLISQNTTLSKKQLDNLLNEFSTYIENGKSGRATNLFAFGLCSNQDLFIDKIRRSGLMRSSKYGYDCRTIVDVCSAVYTHSSQLEICQEALGYLASLKNMYSVLPDLRNLYLSIKKTLTKYHKFVFKSLLVLADLLFLKHYNYDPEKNASTLYHYSREEISESISFLIYLFDSEVGIKIEHTAFVNEEMILNGSFERLVVAACVLKKYQSHEILVDSFGYRCLKTDNGIRFEATSESFERSISLGYIATMLQGYNNVYYTHQEYGKAQYLAEISERFYSEFKKDFL